MSEPALLATPQAAQQGSLWENAPGWRNLTLAASLLTLTAVALPVLLPDPGAPATTIDAAPSVAPQPPSTPPALPPAPTPPPEVPAPAQPGAVASLVPPSAPATAPVAPQTAAEPAAPVCSMVPLDTGPRLEGLAIVMGFEDHASSLLRIQRSEALLRAKIDPDFIENQRVFIRGTRTGRNGVFILPKGMEVKIGDRVMLQSNYRNAALPCNWIPGLIAYDIGPPPPAESSRTGAEPQ